MSTAIPLACRAFCKRAGNAAGPGRPSPALSESPNTTILIGFVTLAAGVWANAVPAVSRTRFNTSMCTNNRNCLSTAPAKLPYDRAMDSLIEPSSLAGLEPDTISISNVNLSLGTGAARVHILKDISLRVASGEALGLIGPSGSGKSTLLMVMAGLERPDSGEVVVNGTPFNALDEDALARFRGRQVGIVFQSFHLIPTMTALENVAVPLELAGNPDATARAAQELTSVGLGHRLHHYPTQLSGGEQQRVALARALAPDPAILVADEPTGNLDEATGKQIVDLLFTKHAERGMTLVLVTHDTSLAQRCDRAGHGRLALVELKAVDGGCPVLGALTLDRNMPVADLLSEHDGAFGAAADSTLLARLDLKIGDRVTVGNATFQIRSVVDAEPDKLAGGVGLGPRFLVSETALHATGLLQPGSLVRWIYRVKLPDNASGERATAALIDDARSALPEAGWEIRSRSNASPQLERTINRFTQFLTLVGLAALLVGGVGVANAVKSHIDRRRDVIASFKALGATGRDVFTIYLTQVVVLAGIGSVIGLAAGAALPFVIVGVFGKLLPLPVIPSLHPDELALSFIYGLLTALAFGLWPLARVHDVPVAALFRDEVAPEWHRPRWSYLALMAVVIALLIPVVIGLAYDNRVAARFVLSSVSA